MLELIRSPPFVTRRGYGILSVNLDDTLGAVFVAFTLSTILYGVADMQFYMYFRRRAKESKRTKIVVLSLGILETLWMMFFAMAVYRILVTDYSNLSSSLETHWTLQAAYIISVVSNNIIMGNFAIRLWTLGRKIVGGRYAAALATIQLLIQIPNFAIGIMYPLLGSTHPLARLASNFGWLNYASFAGSALLSISISSSLYIVFCRMRTGSQRTDSLIFMLIKFSIGMSVLMSLVDIAAIVTLVVSPNTLVYTIAETVHPRINLNSILAFLNAKEFFQKTMDEAPVLIHRSQLLSDLSSGEPETYTISDAKEGLPLHSRLANAIDLHVEDITSPEDTDNPSVLGFDNMA